MLDRYYKKYAVAYIIGNFKKAGKQSLLPPFALTKSLNELTTSEQEEIILFAKNLGVKTYHFKIHVFYSYSLLGLIGSTGFATKSILEIFL